MIFNEYGVCLRWLSRWPLHPSPIVWVCLNRPQQDALANWKRRVGQRLLTQAFQSAYARPRRGTSFTNIVVKLIESGGAQSTGPDDSGAGGSGHLILHVHTHLSGAGLPCVLDAFLQSAPRNSADVRLSSRAPAFDSGQCRRSMALV